METFTLQDAIKIQTDQLQVWKVVLKPKGYGELKAWATEHNHKLTNGIKVIRGTRMQDFILNYSNDYTPSNW